MKKSQLLAIIIAPMATGGLSTIASLTLIIMIHLSKVKLSTTYRRLIFGISSFDIIQSFSQAGSTMFMPTETGLWGAIGNETSCHMQGFLTVLGCSGTVLYSLSLTVYFLFVIKYEVPEAVIKKRVEPFLHAVPILYAITISIYIFATNNYNPSGTICWIESDPPRCADDPDVECVSKGNPDILKWVGAGAPIFIVFALNSIFLAVIWFTAYFKTKKNQTYRHSWVNNSTSIRTNNEQVVLKEEKHQGELCCLSMIRTCCKPQNENRNEMSPLEAYLSRKSKTSIRRQKEISNRAIAFIIGYLLTFVFTAVYRIIDTHSSSPPPYEIVFLSRFFFPLQGFFNVLIYTYPHVITYRRNHEGHSYIRSFWEVVKTGGDSDQQLSGPGRASRRSSLRKQKMVLEQANSRKKKKNGNAIGKAKPSIIDSSDPNTWLQTNTTPADEKNHNEMMAFFKGKSKSSLLDENDLILDEMEKDTKGEMKRVGFSCFPDDNDEAGGRTAKEAFFGKDVESVVIEARTGGESSPYKSPLYCDDNSQ